MERPPPRRCDDDCAHDHAEQYPLLVAVVLSSDFLLLQLSGISIYSHLSTCTAPFPVALGSCGHGVFIADLV